MSEEAVDPERIADAENIRRRIAIKAEPDVKVDLMIVVDTITGAGIEQLARAAARWKAHNIFDEDKGALSDLLLDHQSRLIDEFNGGIGSEEICFHAGECPATAKVE